MLKPTAAFKLSKTAKRMIANCVDANKASHIKRLMVQAELAEAIQPRSPKRRESQGD